MKAGNLYGYFIDESNTFVNQTQLMEPLLVLHLDIE